MSEYVICEGKEFAIKIKSSKHWGSKICYLCGKHIKENDDIALIVLPSDIRFNSGYKKMEDNQVVHLDEIEEFIKDKSSIKEVADALEKHKVKKEILTEKEKEKMKIFVDAAYDLGYHSSTTKSNGIVVCKKNGTSDKVMYNVYTDIIEYSNNRKGYLFDSFIEKQIITDVYNKFHKLLGDNLNLDYNALDSINKCLSEAIDTTNKIMGN